MLSITSIMNIGSFMGGKNKLNFFQANKEMYTQFKKNENWELVQEILTNLDLLAEQRAWISLKWSVGDSDMTYRQIMDATFRNESVQYALFAKLKKNINEGFKKFIEEVVERINTQSIDMYCEMFLQKTEQELRSATVMKIDPYSLL